MLKNLILVLVCAALAQGAIKTNKCTYYNDADSLYQWKDASSICSDYLCKTHPEVNCSLSPLDLEDMAYKHEPEDVVNEIELMKNYSSTYLRGWETGNDFTCHGMCQGETRQITRLFQTIKEYNGLGKLTSSKRHLCYVIGPEIYYRVCSGSCKSPPHAGTRTLPNLQCIASSFIDVQAWVYCIGASQGCNKMRIKVPMACSCSRVVCRPRNQKTQQLDPTVDLSGFVDYQGKSVLNINEFKDPTIFGIYDTNHGK